MDVSKQVVGLLAHVIGKAMIVVLIYLEHKLLSGMTKLLASKSYKDISLVENDGESIVSLS